jgi:VIT1/CCC1 family predicted Fe2+/Mn2+ transporter
MLIAALGCNLAWGIIDAGVYLIARVHVQGRNIMTLRAVRTAADAKAARRIIADALPPALAAVVSEEQLDQMRHRLRSTVDEPTHPHLTKRDWLAGLGVCLLCFLSTFPVAAPFMIVGDARTALRASNAVAVVLLFFCGYAFGHRTGLSPWVSGLFMVVFGGTLVGVAIALGG